MKDEKENTAKEPLENDPRRFAYMIAWRDKYIEALQEQLAGWEEKDALLCSLLYYALASLASETDGQDEREVLIDKREVTKLLDAWECHVRDTGDAYCVRFSKKQEGVQESAKENAQESAQESAPKGNTGEHADGGEAAKN